LSEEDFTEFEQRTAYFNGDAIHALKKGMNILDRIQVTNMAQMQNMFDFPPTRRAATTLRSSRSKTAKLRGHLSFLPMDLPAR
jgi:hypothetical protein